jgi:hypothetical protein
MSTQIMNGGIQAGILRAAKEYNIENNLGPLSPEQEERLAMLEALPKGVWIDLDESGNPISREEADKKELEYLSRFKPIK